MRYFWIGVLAFFMVGLAQARDVVSLGPQDFSFAVKKEFAEQGLGEDVEIEFFGGQTSYVVEHVDTVKIMISGLDISEGQNRFTAKAEIFADGKPFSLTKLYGRYFVVMEVVLPAKDILKDEVIKKEDLVKTTMRSNRVREDMAIREEDLLGKQAVHLIKANKPIQMKDIREEVVVRKGTTVTAIYQHRGLQIVSKLEALEDGSKGHYIKVRNTKSGKELSAKVVNKNVVEIASE